MAPKAVTRCVAVARHLRVLDNGMTKWLRVVAGLVAQVIKAAEKKGIPLLAENALEGGLWNQDSLNQMLANAEHFKRSFALPPPQRSFLPNSFALFCGSPTGSVFTNGNALFHPAQHRHASRGVCPACPGFPREELTQVLTVACL